MSDCQASRLGYRWLAFPSRTASGYGLLGGDDTLSYNGQCNVHTFKPTAFRALPSTAVFALGWTVNSANGTAYAFDLSVNSGGTTAEEMQVCVSSPVTVAWAPADRHGRGIDCELLTSTYPCSSSRCSISGPHWVNWPTKHM